jgi:hypothetical protein
VALKAAGWGKTKRGATQTGPQRWGKSNHEHRYLLTRLAWSCAGGGLLYSPGLPEGHHLGA